MAAPVPPEAAGTAAGVLLYSLICLASTLLLLWLVWVHDERQSYVAMLGFFVTLHTLASIAQQIHTIGWWRDIKVAQYEDLVTGNAELNPTNVSTDLDVALFYIQFYSYNVEALLILFWAIELASSIFQVRVKTFYRFHASLVAKATAAVLPIIQIILLRYGGIRRRSRAGYIVLSCGIMLGSFSTGSLILLAILAQYVRSRITMASWNVRYGHAASGGTHGATASGTPRVPPPSRKIYDRWLVLRFTVGFAALSLFEVNVVNSQIRSVINPPADDATPASPAELDFSAARARGDFVGFCAAVTAGPVAFLVFGTTRTFREYMWNRLVPRVVRERAEAAAAARKARRKGKNGRARDTGGSLPGVHSPAAPGARGGVAGGGFGVPEREDVEAGNGAGGVVLGLRDLALGVARKERDGKSDEWPILDSTGSSLRRGNSGTRGR